MNNITRLQNELAAANAEIEALKSGMNDIVAYLLTDKFYLDSSVQVADVIRRLQEVRAAGTDASYAKLNDLTGPKPVASPHGWSCARCGRPLQDHEIWNDSDAKANERMRLHWIENHSQSAVHAGE